jgi:hypothetical protein
VFVLSAKTTLKKAPQTSARLGRDAALPNQITPRQSRRKTSNKLFSPCCWVKEKRRSVFLEFFCPDQAVDRDASLGHVQRGRLIIFVRCHLIEAERDESGHYGSSRTQFVSQIDSTFCKYVKCQPRGKIGDCIFN